MMGTPRSEVAHPPRFDAAAIAPALAQPMQRTGHADDGTTFGACFLGDAAPVASSPRRGPELDRLDAMFERGPLTLVWGLGGMGKSSLVRVFFHERRPELAPRVTVVEMRPNDSVEQLLANVASRLREAHEVASGWPGASSTLAWVLDAAESRRAAIVLEDLHHGDPMGVAALLREISAYAQASRWIATSRADPELPEIGEQILTLGGLPDVDMRSLAAELVPGLDEVAMERALRVAAGSPWSMRCALAARSSAAVAALPAPPCAGEWLEALALLDVRVHPDALIDVVTAPCADQVSTLVRHGWLERDTSKLRAHDVARSVLLARMGAGRRRGLATRLAAAFSRSADPEELLEAARLWIEVGDMPAVHAILERVGERLLEAGLSARLFTLLEPTQGAPAVRWRLKSAVHVGGVVELAWAISVHPPEARLDRLLVARARSLSGDVVGAIEQARGIGVEAEDAGDAAVAFEAALLAARGLLVLGRAREALEVLDGRAAPDADAAARALAMRARAAVSLDRYADAIAMASELEARLEVIGPNAWREVAQHRVAIYADTGRLCAAEREERRLAATGARLVADEGRDVVRVLLRRLTMARERGRLDEADRLLTQIERRGHAPPALRIMARLSRFRLGCARGDFAGAEALVSETLASARASHDARQLNWALMARQVLGMALATPFDEEEAALLHPGTGALSRYVDAYLRWRRVRSEGRCVPFEIDRGTPTQVALVVGLASVDHAILEGDTARARALADDAATRAREHGWAIYEAEALRARAVAALVSGDAVDVITTADALAARARDLGSRRYALESELFGALCSDAPPLPFLLRVARAGDVTPDCARIARRLLGLAAPTDRVDARLLDAVSARWKHACVEQVVSDPSECLEAAWGIDLARRTVWFGDGRAVDLRRYPLLWALLEALSRGGCVTKAELFARGWEGRTYHPLRDDDRLQVAVGRLRKLFGDEGAPRMVLTVHGQGYALGPGPIWRVSPRAAAGNEGRTWSCVRR